MYEILAAFLLGLGSFFTPCVLPIAPGFIATLAGTVSGRHEVKEKEQIGSLVVESHPPVEKVVERSRKVMFISTGYFVLGFALFFAMIATIIGCFCTADSLIGVEIKHIISWVGGFIMLGLGIYMVLCLKYPRLNFTKTISLEKVKGLNIHTAYITSFIFGATFAAAWTPCVGPLLASILTLAVEHPEIAYNELLVYALGLGTPFLIISLFLTDFQKLMKPLVKRVKYFDLTMALILVAIGIWFIIQQVNL